MDLDSGSNGQMIDVLESVQWTEETQSVHFKVYIFS